MKKAFFQLTTNSQYLLRDQKEEHSKADTPYNQRFFFCKTKQLNRFMLLTIQAVQCQQMAQSKKQFFLFLFFWS
jgi:hypothetical protein